MKVLRPVEPRIGDKRTTGDGRVMEYGSVLGGLGWTECDALPAAEMERSAGQQQRTDPPERAASGRASVSTPPPAPSMIFRPRGSCMSPSTPAWG